MLLLTRRKLGRENLVTSDCYNSGDISCQGYFQGCFFILAMFCMCALQLYTLVVPLISGDVDHW